MIETPRLLLRPFSHDDLDVLARLMSDPAFMRFSGGLKSREETGAFLDKIIGWDEARRPSPFAVIKRDEGKLIGYCGFLHQSVDGEEEIEIGYRLDPNYWNLGLATEAARAVRDHGFQRLKLDRVISLIHPDNAASRRVASPRRTE